MLFLFSKQRLAWFTSIFSSVTPRGGPFFFQYQYERVYLSICNVFRSIPFPVLAAALIVHLWAFRSHFRLLPRPFDNPIQISFPWYRCGKMF